MCSHFFHNVFGKSGLGSIVGDILGGVAGFALGGPVGAAIGAGLGGATGSAVSGGSVLSDILAGATGAIGGYGLGSLASDLGLSSLTGLGTAAADTGTAAAGDVASALGTSTGTTVDTSLAPAAQATSTAAAAEAPTAVASAPLSVAAPSAVSVDPVTGAITTDVTGAATSAAQGLGIAPSTTDITLAGTSTAPAAAGGGATAADLTGAGGTAATGTTAASGATGGIVDTSQYLDTSLVQPTGEAMAKGAVDVGSFTTSTSSPDLLTRVTDALGLTSSGASSTSDTGTLGSILGSPTTKLLGTAISAGSLGYDMLKGSNVTGLSELKSLASSLNSAASSTGQIYANYLSTGQLPSGVQASIDQATNDAITSVKQKYASMGVAPNSTAEAQDIAYIKQNAVVSGAKLADQLTSTGTSLTSLAGTLYNDLINYNTSLNTQTGQAIANLASSLAGGGTTIKLSSS